LRFLFLQFFFSATYPNISAVTFGAGVQWTEAYNFAQKQGRTIVGGLAQTISAAGGWVMGGGHGMLSPKLGLGMPPSFSCSFCMLKFTIS
jgi:hypothetical protein